MPVVAKIDRKQLRTKLLGSPESPLDPEQPGIMITLPGRDGRLYMVTLHLSATKREANPARADQVYAQALRLQSLIDETVEVVTLQEQVKT
jgi:hypothetical protein